MTVLMPMRYHAKSGSTSSDVGCFVGLVCVILFEALPAACLKIGDPTSVELALSPPTKSAMHPQQPPESLKHSGTLLAAPNGPHKHLKLSADTPTARLDSFRLQLPQLLPHLLRLPGGIGEPRTLNQWGSMADSLGVLFLRTSCFGIV